MSKCPGAKIPGAKIPVTFAGLSGRFFLFFLVHEVGDNQGAGCVACDVDGGPAHVEDTVDAGYQGDSCYRKSYGFEYHGQHDHAGSRYAGGSDRGQGSGQDDGKLLRNGQVYAKAAGDEDCADALVNSGSVHVDRGSERKGEADDIAAGTELFCAFHVKRKGTDGGSAGESEEDSRHHTLEEFDGTDACHKLDCAGVYDNSVQDIADVGTKQYHRQAAQDSRPIFRDDRNHQAEDTDRGKIEDDFHNLQADFADTVAEISEHPAFLTGQDDAETEEKGSDNDLQHGRVGKGFYNIRRKNIDNGVHEAGCFSRFVLQAGNADNRIQSLKDIGDEKSDKNSSRRCTKVIDYGTDADLADLADIR